jgi:hypothetical protein
MEKVGTIFFAFSLLLSRSKVGGQEQKNLLSARPEAPSTKLGTSKHG